MSEDKCYCASCIDVRERQPQTRDVPGHIVASSDEGTIAYIQPGDIPLKFEWKRRRNWLKDALR